MNRAGASRATVLATVVSMIFTAGAALVAGADRNWDLLNYHVWGVHALLHGRHFVDVAPAQIQSWYNPIVQLPSYAVVRFTEPLFGSLIMGAWAGLNGGILYLLTTRLLPTADERRRILVGALVVACGITGPVFLGQAGTTFADVLTSALVIGALAASFHPDGPRFGRAGVLLGAAAGLKLTNAVYAVAMLGTLVVHHRGWRVGGTALGRFAAGGIFGTLATGGAWAAYLYSETGNPIFPYMNTIFASPLYEAVGMTDRRFVPDSVMGGVAYPLRWMIGQHPSAEVPFRDARFLLAFVALGMVAIARLLRRRRDDETSRIVVARAGLVGTFFAISFAVWISTWAIHRYATALELLAGLIVLIGLDRLPIPTRAKTVAFAVIVVAIVGWTRPADWGRHEGFGSSYFGIDPVRAEQVSAGGVLFVIVADWDPVAYALPYLADDARFVRLNGNMGLLFPGARLGRRASSAVARHSGPIRLLSPRAWKPLDARLLALYGLERDEAAPCALLETRLDTFRICPLERLDG